MVGGLLDIIINSSTILMNSEDRVGQKCFVELSRDAIWARCLVTEYLIKNSSSRAIVYPTSYLDLVLK